MINKLGLQMWTLRDTMNTPENVRMTFRRMKEMGFEIAQTAGCNIPYEEYAQIAKEEGIDFKLLCNPIRINCDDNGMVSSISCIKMELGEPDESGRRRPKEIDGSEFEIPVQSVIMALGTTPNPLIRSTTDGLETNRRGCFVVDENMKTTKDSVYAGGDAVTGAATVILAMGAGKNAAKAIDEYLKTKLNDKI